MVRFTEPKPRTNHDFIVADAPSSIEVIVPVVMVPRKMIFSVILIVQLMFCANP
jgi:hypothetical protein